MSILFFGLDNPIAPQKSPLIFKVSFGRFSSISFENLINNNKIETIYGWIVKDVTLITNENDKLEESVFEGESESGGEGEIIIKEEIENINTEEDLY